MFKNGSYVKCSFFKINLKIFEIFNILNYFLNKIFNLNRIFDVGFTWFIFVSFWFIKQILIVIISRSFYVIFRSQFIIQCMQLAVILQILNNYFVILVFLSIYWVVYFIAVRVILGVVVLLVIFKFRGGGFIVYIYYIFMNELLEVNINYRDYFFKL